MALDIGTVVKRGASRTFERNGLLLMGVFFLFKLVNMVVGQSFSVALREQMRQLIHRMPEMAPGEFSTEPMPFALDVPFGVALLLVLVVAIVAEAIFIVAVRTMVSDETETVPREFVRRRILGATANGIVGGIVVSVLTVVGLIFFVVPGIFLALSFFFVRQEIAVADKNFIDAMAGSWDLAKGNRIELFAIAVIILLAGILAGALTVPLALLGPAVTTVVGNVFDAVFTVFGVAVAARAYDQLRTEATESAPGALGPDELAEYENETGPDPAEP